MGGGSGRGDRDNSRVTVPANPRIYHITHVDNLQQIVTEGALWSDAVMVQRGGPPAAIGMNSIKYDRLTKRPVKCYPADFVGAYVPFNFCPRSVMLYILHKDNAPGLTYHGGQGPLIHLEADLMEAIAWADAVPRRWAFTLANAGAVLTEFRNSVDRLDDIDWSAVATNDWSGVKDGKQAEFLMYESFPWSLVRSIGVHSTAVEARVNGILGGAGSPQVAVRRDWYY